MELTTYQNINQNMQKELNDYFQMQSDEDIKSFILEQKFDNKYKMVNRLIEIPKKNIKQVIRDQYMGRDYLEGEIGTVNATDQFDGITQIALLTLISNRVSKKVKSIKNELEKEVWMYDSELKSLKGKNENNYQALKQNMENAKKRMEIMEIKYRNAMFIKDTSLSNLMACLYVFNETEEEYRDTISYGKREDDKGKESFAIDIPYIGQICVHFGRTEKMEMLRKIAKEKAATILDRKCELGQLSKEETEKIKKQLSDDTILPEYKGKLYEYSAAIPLEYEGNKIKEVKQILSLDKKLPEDINEDDINRICNSRLNDREKYYLAIKLGMQKAQLEQMTMKLQVINVKKMGRDMLNKTNPQERSIVKKHEFAQREYNQRRTL